jgi:hypothetical protein
MVTLCGKVLKPKDFFKMTTLCTLSFTVGNRVIVMFISCSLYKGWNLLFWLGILFTKIDVIQSVFTFWPMVIKPKCLFLCSIIAL